MIQEMKYHHIGIACEDIAATCAHYAELGYKAGPRIIDELQNIEICFLEHDSMPRLELLAAVDENSPVVRTLKTNGTTPYHICYSVADISSAIKQLKKQRFLVVAAPKPACAIENHRVAFLYHKDVGLIELVES